MSEEKLNSTERQKFIVDKSLIINAFVFVQQSANKLHKQQVKLLKKQQKLQKAFELNAETPSSN